jgi:hypothetical protein
MDAALIAGNFQAEGVRRQIFGPHANLAARRAAKADQVFLQRVPGSGSRAGNDSQI